MTKKGYKQKNVFFILSKNLYWEILSKNWVTFKRWDGIKMKNLNIIRFHQEIRFFKVGGERGGSRKTNI